MPILDDREREALARFRAAYAASKDADTDQQTGNRLGFVRWLVATGDIDEGDAAPAPVCTRCRRPMTLTAIQVARIAQQLPITHAMCGMPQMVGA